MDIKIIFEDQHILVVNKPPKMPSCADKSGDLDMLSYLHMYLKEEYPLANKPYIGLIHRLDRPVGGVMIFAKTRQSNISLSKQLKENKLLKKYFAVVCGEPKIEKDELRDFLSKNERLNTSRVVSESVKNSKLAILGYEIIKSVTTQQYGVLSIVDITLKTGRHHQIRVQFANLGVPLWGDTKYNPLFASGKKRWSQIALWATEINFCHPKTNEALTFTSNPPDNFPFSLFF